MKINSLIITILQVLLGILAMGWLIVEQPYANPLLIGFLLLLLVAALQMLKKNLV